MIIRVRLDKNKVFIPQLINKLFVNLAAVNILIYLAISQVLYTVWSFYKANISYNIAYEAATVEYLLITNIVVKVYIII